MRFVVTSATNMFTLWFYHGCCFQFWYLENLLRGEFTNNMFWITFIYFWHVIINRGTILVVVFRHQQFYFSYIYSRRKEVKCEIRIILFPTLGYFSSLFSTINLINNLRISYHILMIQNAIYNWINHHLHSTKLWLYENL
mgnify:CR=1 FL=1